MQQKQSHSKEKLDETRYRDSEKIALRKQLKENPLKPTKKIPVYLEFCTRKSTFVPPSNSWW